MGYEDRGSWDWEQIPDPPFDELCKFIANMPMVCNYCNKVVTISHKCELKPKKEGQ
jgi:hypothetical protein